MIDIKNLRIENRGIEGTMLIADISSDIDRTDNETTIWISVDKENEDMLSAETYNAFLFLPLYMGMYYHSDVHIHGAVSKGLFRRVNDYLQPILCSFSDKLSPIKLIVDGFCECSSGQTTVGTGISCGIDSLSTVYRYFENENDPDYKLNALFMFNCGWHGEYGDKKTIEVFKSRCKDNKKAADEMGLRFITVDSNLHAFLPYLNDQASYFCLYSCVFALEKAIKRYYLASSYSYEEIMRTGYSSRNRDFSEYGDAMTLPLLHSTRCEIVSDGCQQSRTLKTKMIADWNISKKYLNVCCINDVAENCSCCQKCVRTMIALDAMGKLDSYSGVFDLKKWKDIRKDAICQMVINSRISEFARDNYEFCKKQGMKVPTLFSARIHYAPRSLKRLFTGVYFRKMMKKLHH